MKVEIAILAGGQSKRMGRNKASALIGGETMAQRIERAAAKVGPTLLIDRDTGESRGPLSGVLTAFTRSKASGLLFLSCDMPFVSPEMLARVVKEAKGRPLFSIQQGRHGFPFCLPRSCKRAVAAQLKAGKHSLQDLAHALRAKTLAWPDNSPELLNVNTPSDLRQAREALRASEAAFVINIDGMSIRRGKVTILDRLSWSVRKGEHWVILGANGSGKTSLLSAITGYLTPSEGHISVLGQIYGDSDWRELRKKVGLVSSALRQMMADSEPALHTVASGAEGIIDLWGNPRRADAARARMILEQVECSYLADRPWAVLSQGERQRVLIGRALMARPALLILDEPCAGLDPAAREHFLQFLERLAKSKNAPCLTLVTHHVEEITPAFSQILLLKDGQLLAAGAKKAMLTNKLLSQTFNSPVTLFRRKHRFFLEVSPSPRKVI